MAASLYSACFESGGRHSRRSNDGVLHGHRPTRPGAGRAHDGARAAVPSVNFKKGSLELSFFSMIASVGAPLDITAQELRIEAFFPADAVTEAFAQEHLRSDDGDAVARPGG